MPGQVILAGSLLVIALVALTAIGLGVTFLQTPDPLGNVAGLLATESFATQSAHHADPDTPPASPSQSLAVLAQPQSENTGAPEMPSPTSEAAAEATVEPAVEPAVALMPAPSPTATSGAISEPTVEPTVVPTTEPIAEPPPAVDPPPLPQQAALSGIRHMWQTWNNCGPATLAMNLSFYGSGLSQAEIGAAIRTHPEDKNVNAEELAVYARQQGFGAQARVNGSQELVRRFIANGIPVLIETWLEPDPNDGFGHYRLLTGYDDSTQRWIAHDSYVAENMVNANPESYAGIYLPYAETDRLWAVYNRTYVLVYPHDKADLVAQILGDEADPDIMWERALARAQEQVAQEQSQGIQSPFSWFNLGSSLYYLGFHHEAAAAFDRARAIGLPWRMLWYQFEPFAAYYAVGRNQDVVDLARTTLATTRELEEVQYWYGMGLAGLGDSAGARQAWEYALSLKPAYPEARQALESLGGG